VPFANGPAYCATHVSRLGLVRRPRRKLPLGFAAIGLLEVLHGRRVAAVSRYLTGRVLLLLLAVGYVGVFKVPGARRRRGDLHSSLRMFMLLAGAIVVAAAALGSLALFDITKSGRGFGICVLLFASFAAVPVGIAWRAERHFAAMARQSAQPMVTTSAADAVLSVHRTFVNGPRDLLARYRIRLDGRVVGEVWPGETLRLRIEPGSHEVCALATWPFRGPAMRFEAIHGSLIELECFPANPHGSPADLLRPRSWIALRPAPSDAAPVTRSDAKDSVDGDILGDDDDVEKWQRFAQRSDP
jgi:hypothetical protein